MSRTMYDMSLLLEKAKATKKKREEERQKEKDKREKEKEKREKERDKRAREMERKEKEREEQEQKRTEKAAKIEEEQVKKKKAEEVSGHKHNSTSPHFSSPSALVSADISQRSGVASTGDVVSMARPVVVKPITPTKKVNVVSLAECVRVRDEFLQLRNLLGAKLNRTSIIEQHTKTLRGTVGRQAFSELAATYTQDLQEIADILVANKSSSSFSKLQVVISEQTMKELGELESYKKVFLPLVSVTVSDSVSLGELPAVDHSNSSPRELVTRTAVSPKLSPLAALQQEIERMKKDAVALETAIKEGAAAVLVLQEQQRKEEEEVAALRERQSKLAVELETAVKKLSELEEYARVEAEAVWKKAEEEARKRVEAERIRVEGERRKKLEAEVDAEDLGKEVAFEDEAETEIDLQAMFLAFQQFMKAQALAKKKAVKKKVVESDHEAPPHHTSSTPPL